MTITVLYILTTVQKTVQFCVKSEIISSLVRDISKMTVPDLPGPSHNGEPVVVD